MTCIMHTSNHWCQLPGIYQSGGAEVGKLYLSQYQKFSPVCSVNLKKNSSSVRSDEAQLRVT